MQIWLNYGRGLPIFNQPMNLLTPQDLESFNVFNIYQLLQQENLLRN
jgi:hypothetical protein